MSDHRDCYQCNECAEAAVALKANLADVQSREIEALTELRKRAEELDSVQVQAGAMRKELKHDVPSGCWATGPNTGDVIEDLIICPGCRALSSGAGRALLDELEKLRTALDDMGFQEVDCADCERNKARVEEVRRKA